MLKFRHKAVALSLLAFGIMTGTGVEAATDKSKVMLVLDASGSMWGRVDGRPKIEIARDVIGDLVSDWDPAIELGLSAYGHRQKGDCGDIQTLQKAGPVNPVEFMRVVNSISPKGKTPLSEAVSRAAKELRYTEEKATVILISDGIETCNQNACKVGEDLAKAGIDFKTHVIGFDLKLGEEKSLICLAENTGGQFLSAKNATGLQDALQATVTKVKVEAAKPVVVAQAPAPVKKDPVIAPGQHFRAFMTAGGEQINGNMRWDVYQAEADQNGKRKNVGGNYQAAPSFKLAAGNYRAVAKWGNAVASVEFTVASEKQGVIHDVIMDAGIIRLSAVLADGQKAVTSNMRWDVYQSAQGIDGKRPHVNGNYEAAPRFFLNSGNYFVVAKNGNATVSGEISITAGKVTEKMFNLNAGLAVFTANFDEAGQAVNSGLRWDVYSVEKNIDGKRKFFNGNYDTKPKFMLPQGKYYVVAKRGNAFLARDIEVSAGKRTDELFVLNAGLMRLSAVLADGKETVAKGMRWDVYSIDKNLEGKRQHFNGNYEATPAFTFNKGKYFVVAKLGSAIKSAEVEINSGKLTETIVNLNAGQVKLIAKAKDGKTVSKGLRWDVYSADQDLDGNRKNFGGNYEASPIFTLPSGKYLVVVKVGGTKANFDLTVNSGDSKRVDVPMN